MGRFLFATQPCKLARGFVGLGATVAEKRLPTKSSLVESLGELNLWLGMESVPNMPELVRLIGRRAYEGWVTMPQNSSAKTLSPKPHPRPNFRFQIVDFRFAYLWR